ncbi:MAG: hypothetical protein HQL36_01115 [Alphaproteobacteria bacterium]|nr:hypothetical protein [Alphaproteobacteria bacterium]MBF0251833.1 hypothetical protein [Alphaproteobacteria bacterium]
MKRKTILVSAALASALAVGAFVAGDTWAQAPWSPMQGYGPGYGMMQPGYGMMQPGYGMMQPGFGPGGMRHGHGPGMGPCAQAQGDLKTPLTADGVRAHLEQMLAWRGQGLKIGSITEPDDKTIVAEIVNADGQVFRKIQFDKATGQRMPIR